MTVVPHHGHLGRPRCDWPILLALMASELGEGGLGDRRGAPAVVWHRHWQVRLSKGTQSEISRSRTTLRCVSDTPHARARAALARGDVLIAYDEAMRAVDLDSNDVEARFLAAL